MTNHSSPTRTTSDDDTTATLPLQTHTTSPRRTPSFRTILHKDKGPRIMYVARKKVHLPRKPSKRTWGWLPYRLQAWREEEMVPTTSEVGESSTTTPIPPITQEPVHHTVPVLAARMVRHESRIDKLENELSPDGLELLQHQISESGDHISHLLHTISTMREEISELRDEATNLSQRVVQSNRRAELAEQRNDMLERRVTAIEQDLERVGTLGNIITQMADAVTAIDRLRE